MVSVSSPILCHSEEDADKMVSKYKNPNGKFELVATTKDLIFYFYCFEYTTPANKAKRKDFAFTEKVVDIDKIFPLSRTQFQVEVGLIPVKHHKRALEHTLHRAISEACQCADTLAVDGTLSLSVSTFQRKLTDHVKTTVLIASPVEAKGGEVALNEQLKDEIQELAEKNGYIVTTDKAGELSGFNASRYQRSRPDIIIYHPTHCHAFLVTGDCDEDSEEEVSIVAAVTENKLDSCDSAFPQLLAGMEKVAGDIAFKYVTSSSHEDQVFEHIEIFALVINYREAKCKAYQLHMDFKSTRSILFYSDTLLSLSEGVNRLFSALNDRLVPPT